MSVRSRRWAALPLAFITLLGTSACSDDSDAADATDSTTAPTEAPTEATEAAGSGDTSAPAGPDLDPDCLQGLWNMDLTELTDLLQSTYPIPDLLVPLGSASLEFVGEQAVFLAQFRLEVDLDDVVLQADADFRRTGDVTVSGPNLDVAFITAEGGIDPFVEVNADGSTTSAPIAPTLDPPDLVGEGAVCTADTLTLFESGSGVPGEFVFTRAAG